MDWKEYEKEIFDALHAEYPSASISLDRKLLGHRSKVKRQCDILIEEEIAGAVIRTVVEAKFHKRPIDIKGVETFVGMLEDLNVQRGLMVAPAGYTKSAKQRALRASTKLELDILNPIELGDFQAHWAIPYVEDVGVVVRAPFGWVVDGGNEHPWAAMFYPRGTDIQTAADNVNFMYAEFWKKTNEVEDELSLLMENQNNSIIGHYGQTNVRKIETQKGPVRNDSPSLIRTALIGVEHCELSGFVDFSKFIFFCVMHCNDVDIPLNTRKLWNLMETVIPANVSHSKRSTD